MQHKLNLDEGSWVYIYAPHTSPPEGDALANRKLLLDWAGPYLFLENDTMAIIGKMDAGGRVVNEFSVHLTRQQQESHTPPVVKPGWLPDFGDSAVTAY